MAHVDPVRVLGKVQSIQIEKGRTVLTGGHGKLKRYDEEHSRVELRLR